MTVVGIETEYGVHPDLPPGEQVDPEVLSAAVVGAREHTNRMLGNGARYYVDHAHPEYSGPEVTSALDAATWDRAGDLIVARDAAAASATLGFPVTVVKNNTDGRAAWGRHENYLVPREVPFARIVDGFTSYLVTRQIIQGAGRAVVGRDGEEPGFQISQRADFIETRVGLDTTARRSIINTRDEPHASDRWRRLHVITADANLIGFATWLTVGGAQLALAAVCAGLDDAVPRLADPVSAFHRISRDPDAPLTCTDGVTRTAWEMQHSFLAAAHRALSVGVPTLTDAADVVREWRRLLDDLAADPRRAADRVDWIAKKSLMEATMARHGVGWDSPEVAAIDLLYHALDERRGLAWTLARAGRTVEVTDPASVQHAQVNPPTTTRAWLRGTLIRDHPDRILAADWSTLILRSPHGTRTIAIPEPLDDSAHTTGPARLQRLLREEF